MIKDDLKTFSEVVFRIARKTLHLDDLKHVDYINSVKDFMYSFHTEYGSIERVNDNYIFYKKTINMHIGEIRQEGTIESTIPLKHFYIEYNKLKLKDKLQ